MYGAAWECVCVCVERDECVWSEMRLCVWSGMGVCVERHGSVCGAVRTELPWTRHGVHRLSSGRGPHRSVGLQAQVMGEDDKTHDT